MNLDPRVQGLFTRAENAFDGETFVAAVMAGINRERRRLIVFWIGLSAIFITGLALLAPAVVTGITMVTNLLPVSLVEVETGWLRQLLAPVNSVAAAIALGALGIRKFFRWALG